MEQKAGKQFDIVVTEIPYQVNKARLVERIADRWSWKHTALKTLDPAVRAVGAEYWHFVETAGPLSEPEALVEVESWPGSESLLDPESA